LVESRRGGWVGCGEKEDTHEGAEVSEDSISSWRAGALVGERARDGVRFAAKDGAVVGAGAEVEVVDG
jgi:hypothetical protein